jgi:hypothetical protein
VPGSIVDGFVVSCDQSYNTFAVARRRQTSNLIATVPGNSLLDCAEACRAQTGCIAFNFLRATNGGCQLLSNVDAGTSPVAGVDSGIIADLVSSTTSATATATATESTTDIITSIIDSTTVVIPVTTTTTKKTKTVKPYPTCK